jgi:hypothetical protein
MSSQILRKFSRLEGLFLDLQQNRAPFKEEIDA